MQALSIVPGIFMCPVVVLLGFMHQIVIAVHCLVGFASRRAGASVLVKIGVTVGLACVMFGFAELAVGTASAVGCFASVFLRLASVTFEASVMMPLVSRAWMGVMRRGCGLTRTSVVGLATVVVAMPPVAVFIVFFIVFIVAFLVR